jgi:alkanesulfonate monooxygenase SsuD/methylene tetrahydromethanopterin reductase-like flavin-dependent oxidoreductase (luciferase family)
VGPSEDVRDVLGQVQLADRVGLDSVLFEEDRGELGSPGATSLAAAAAARTSAIRVGAANLCPLLNHPIRVAEDWAVTDLIARGRTIVGLSPGDRRSDFDAAGVPWEDRHERFRECVELIRTAWTRDSFQFVGDHVTFPLGASGKAGWRPEPYERPYVDQWRRGQVVPEFLSVTPKPVQLPHPPVWIAGRRREEIEWAAQRGFTFLHSALDTEDELRERVGWYRETLEASGRDVREVDIAVMRDAFVADVNARELALPSLRARLDAAIEHNTAKASLDDDKLLETCWLVGTSAEVVDRLKQLQSDTGLTHVVCRVHDPGRPRDAVDACIRLLASEVQTRMAV